MVRLPLWSQAITVYRSSKCSQMSQMSNRQLWCLNKPDRFHQVGHSETLAFGMWWERSWDQRAWHQNNTILSEWQKQFSFYCQDPWLLTSIHNSERTHIYWSQMEKEKKKKHAYFKMPNCIYECYPCFICREQVYLFWGLHLTLCVRYTNSERGIRWKLMASLNTSMVGKIKAISIN